MSKNFLPWHFNSVEFTGSLPENVRHKAATMIFFGKCFLTSRAGGMVAHIQDYDGIYGVKQLLKSWVAYAHCTEEPAICFIFLSLYVEKRSQNVLFACLKVSLSIVAWRSLFSERNRWRSVMNMQLVLLLLMPPMLMSVGVVSLLQKSTVRSVGSRCITRRTLWSLPYLRYCLSLFDIGLWRKFTVTTYISKFKSSYNKCIRSFLCLSP